MMKAVPKGFLPKNDEAQFEISMRTPEGTSLAATAHLGRADRAPGARAGRRSTTTLLTIGDNSQQTPNLASIFVRLKPPDQRKASQDELQDRVRNEIVPKQPKEFRISASAVAAFGGGTFSTATVQYILTGPDLNAGHRLLEADRPQAEGDPGRGRRRHHAGDRQPRAGGHASTGARRPIWASTSPTWRSPRSC